MFYVYFEFIMGRGENDFKFSHLFPGIPFCVLEETVLKTIYFTIHFVYIARGGAAMRSSLSIFFPKLH